MCLSPSSGGTSVICPSTAETKSGSHPPGGNARLGGSRAGYRKGTGNGSQSPCMRSPRKSLAEVPTNRHKKRNSTSSYELTGEDLAPQHFARGAFFFYSFVFSRFDPPIPSSRPFH